MKTYKLILTVPETHTELLLSTLWDAWAGIIGNYSHCSYTIKWVGRFLPLSWSNPTIGKIWQLEEVNEDQIQIDVTEDKIHNVIETMKRNHPYEEIAYDIFEKINL